MGLKQSPSQWPRGEPPAAIEVHIEELVLHGFAPHDQQRIMEAVRSELTRLFATRNLPGALRRGGEVEQVSGGAFHVAHGAPAEANGRQVARAVFGGLRG